MSGWQRPVWIGLITRLVRVVDGIKNGMNRGNLKMRDMEETIELLKDENQNLRERLDSVKEEKRYQRNELDGTQKRVM